MSYCTTNLNAAVLCAPQSVSYPFLNATGDANAKIYVREYVQNAANFVPAARTNTATLPSETPFAADNAAYLVEESDPTTALCNVVRFTRKWATVPADQVTYSTISLNKPSPSSVAETSGPIVGSSVTHYGFSTALFVATTMYSVVGASRTSINSNWAGITANGHGLTANTNAILQGYFSNIYCAQEIPYSNVSIVNSNYFLVAGVVNTVIVSGLIKAGYAKRTYTPGTDRVRVKRTTSFYLPGVTENISSPSDIPIPDPATNDQTLLSLVVNYSSGYQVYDADALQPWIGPIYQQTKTEIDMANL